MLLQALEETDRLRTVLLQSVSHDLRTPLTAITAARLGAADDVPEHEREALLAGIEQEADRLSRLVANMLDLSRIETGVLQPRRTVCRSTSCSTPRSTTPPRRSATGSSTSTAPRSCRRSASTRR